MRAEALNSSKDPLFMISSSQFLKRLYLFIFRERRKEGDREGEKYQYVVASYMTPTGDLACNPGMCPDWESNLLPFGHRPELNPLSHTS